MNFAQPTSPGATWAAATRTLTGEGGAITTNTGTDNTALANGSTAGFATSVGQMQIMTIVGIGAANVTWNTGLISGATFRSGIQGVSGSSLMTTSVSNSTIGFAINNSGTVSGNYTVSIIRWNA